MRNTIPLAGGLLFGAGLTLSGMTDPLRVRAFLNIFGHWDPTLAFVMAGALVPMAIAHQFSRRSERPLAAERFFRPSQDRIDARLIAGAVIFGVGWGIAGLCPGPALAAFSLNPLTAVVFVVAMLAGMAVYRVIATSIPAGGNHRTAEKVTS